MNWTSYDPDDMMNNYFIQNTYKALVDAIIPRTSKLAEEYGRVQYYGALDLQVDEYLIYTLDFYSIPLAWLTAKSLDAATKIFLSSNRRLIPSRFSETGIFATLNPIDRFRVLTLLEQRQINPEDLQVTYEVDLELVLPAISSLDRLTMMGYYSEWSGYGSTRLATPDQRVLEFYPLSWQQIGYPGPSLGYRVLRTYNFT